MENSKSRTPYCVSFLILLAMMPHQVRYRHLMRKIGFIFLVVFALIPEGHAQYNLSEWPKEPIQLIVGYAAGGSTDVLARKIAAVMSQEIGQQIIIVNKPGAGGTIGMSMVSHAKPDGYTLGIGSSATHATSLISIEKQPYNPVMDFSPVIKLVDYNNVLVANPKLPFKDMEGMLKFIKEKNGNAAFGSAGLGSTNQLSMEIVLRNFGVSMIHTPYKGSGPALVDVIAGHIDMMFDITNTTIPHIKSGELNAIAIAAPKRNSQLPDVPTLGEVGVKVDSAEVYNLWIGIFAPPRTPKEIIKKANKAFAKAMLHPDVQKSIADMGLTIDLEDSDKFTKTVERDYKYWSRFVEKNTIK